MKNAYWKNIFTNWGKKESENVTIIKKIPIFANLNHKELEEVSKLLHDRTYKPDEYIFKRHAPGEGMFIIHSGIVNIIVGEASGNSQLLAELSNGDFFGEMALMEDEVRSAAALAKDHSRLLGFFRPDLEALIEINPSLGSKILQNLSKVVCTRLRKTNDLLMENQLVKKKKA
ncbi:MAG: cyclic nucleotide-binding domain-containing protein [Candidatus Neomarinimicrobiota bacterium]|nr:MAG: cyclic nucleotide-binding domain-containing protein [bacterium]